MQQAQRHCARKPWGIVTFLSAALMGFLTVPTVTPDALVASETVVKVTLTGYKIEMSRTTVPAGTPVRFEVTNKDGIVHEFVVERAGQVDAPLSREVGGKKVESEIEDIAPGKTETLEWSFTQPGAYWAACHIAGHFEAGMKIDFTVTAGGL